MIAKLAARFLEAPPRHKRRVGVGDGVLHVLVVKKIPDKGKRDLEAIKALRFGPGMGNFHMTTVSKANKSRLTIRGLVDGRRYIVREQPGGWFITPEKAHRVKKTGMSAEDFVKLYRSRTPLDADTAKEISANLARMDQAK